MQILWIGIVIIWFIYNSSVLGRWTIGLILTIGTLSLISMIAKRNYFEIIEDKLIINTDFFRTKMVDLKEIERIDIGSGPFTSSKIILKDKSVIKYADSQLSDNELKEVFGRLNIPVE